MATLNLSSEGPSINKSYQSVVDAPAPTGAAASSPTYGQWAVYVVAAPLVSAFQQDSSKESVLKVQSTGEGELEDLIEEFSDGRIQFAFAKVKDPNSKLPKCVLVAWCGGGVPERTKGYFTSHLATVSKLLHGYHVQVTARSDNDLTPEGVIRKVADSSGSKYSSDSAPASSSGGPPPPIASKPVFTPTQSGGGRGFNPLGSRSRAPVASGGPTDSDGWGEDAPAVTRTQLERVAPAYKPTKVNMAELTSQKQAPSRVSGGQESSNGNPDVVRGAYQPVGKVDIAAIRRQAQESGSAKDDRPAPVKGSYEPVGKVDIAAIRARAQPSSETPTPTPTPKPTNPAVTGGSNEGADGEPKSLADRSAAFTQSERLTTLPKPKVSNRFGGGASSFTGTKAPTPISYESKTTATAAPVGTASKNFADEGGKTPAQIWAEKKARQRGESVTSDTNKPAPASPMASQTSGGGQWESGYTGKKWGGVQTTRTGQSGGAVSQQATGEQPPDIEPETATGGVSAIRDRFKNAAPMGGVSPAARDDYGEEEDETPAAPPPMNMSTKPVAARGVPMPGFAQQTPADEDIPAEESSRMPTPPPQPPRSPTPPTPPAFGEGSPVRIAQPVARGMEPAEQFSPPPMPTSSLAEAAPAEHELEEEPQIGHQDPARGASQAAAVSTFGEPAAASAAPGAGVAGKRALVQFDYEKAEDNEIELKEGQYVTNIDMVDEDWWMGENEQGDRGLFPANYVELAEDEAPTAAVEQEPPAAPAAPVAAAAPAAASHSSGKPSATAQYDYEAAEENELSFPEGATITNLEFPDEDWWLGEFNGQQGLFPANYVELVE